MPRANAKIGDDPEDVNEGPWLVLRDCPTDLSRAQVRKALSAAEKTFKVANIDPLFESASLLYQVTWNQAQAAVDEVLGTPPGGEGPKLFVYVE